MDETKLVTRYARGQAERTWTRHQGVSGDEDAALFGAGIPARYYKSVAPSSVRLAHIRHFVSIIIN
jgi:hypothetical protein